MGAVRCKLPCSGPGSLALPCDDPASLSLPQATCSLPTLLSISFPEVQSPEPAIRWRKQWQQRELPQHQHPGACRSPWKPREGRAPRDRQPAPCLLSDPHPRYSTWEMKALRRRGGSQPGGEPGEAGFGQRPPGGAGEGLREGSGRWRQVGRPGGEPPGDWPGARGDVTRRRFTLVQVEKPAQPRVPGVGQWFPPHLFRRVLRSRARLAALPLVLPGPLTHTLRSTFAPLCGPSSPRTHRRAWNRAPRPGWRGCWSRRPH